ncbi:inositol-3-phosphate synthase [Geoglobus acetivorans]|uniref:Inositol-1-phosphate synthase n=1 Tax=Geoglobus acetivorans TaxID=565033 RepID=A0A0A7GDX6_GEOAI|nr:Inositol-1-phosphate synthase [Geoglobus acetivorans]
MKIWFIGAYGIVSTTAMAGGKLIEQGRIDNTGLVSSLPQFEGIEKYAPLRFEFGGHEVRKAENAYIAALQHWEQNRHFEKEYLEEVRGELEQIRASKGTAINCGSGVQALGELEVLENEKKTLAEIVEQLEKDLKSFADDDTVVINSASTEPLLNYSEKYHGSLDGFEEMIENDVREHASASILYAYVALKNRIPYGNFTPSAGSSIPALKELAVEKKVPHAGNDGKTGETLVKTTLAPMFAYRNLRVLGWMSYNILGDLDGLVLSHRENKESKVISKDKVLEKIYGYSPFSITQIEYFPSLVDNKTAFDFIHFQGFLGTQMKFYFIWDAIDAIVAAPLTIDIARFLLFAKKKGLYGVIKEMGFFFKSPMDTNNVNTHSQFVELVEWFKENI